MGRRESGTGNKHLPRVFIAKLRHTAPETAPKRYPDPVGRMLTAGALWHGPMPSLLQWDPLHVAIQTTHQAESRTMASSFDRKGDAQAWEHKHTDPFSLLTRVQCALTVAQCGATCQAVPAGAWPRHEGVVDGQVLPSPPVATCRM